MACCMAVLRAVDVKAVVSQYSRDLTVPSNTVEWTRRDTAVKMVASPPCPSNSIDRTELTDRLYPRWDSSGIDNSMELLSPLRSVLVSASADSWLEVVRAASAATSTASWMVVEVEDEGVDLLLGVVGACLRLFLSSWVDKEDDSDQSYCASSVIFNACGDGVVTCRGAPPTGWGVIMGLNSIRDAPLSSLLCKSCLHPIFVTAGIVTVCWLLLRVFIVSVCVCVCV
jgi:hypothetical protein